MGEGRRSEADLNKKDLQMRVECSTMKAKNARVCRQHGSSSRCGVRRRNKAGTPVAYLLHSMCAPGETPGHEGAPAFPSGANRWCGMVAVTSCLGGFLGFRQTNTKPVLGLPCPTRHAQTTLCCVCRPGVAYGSSHVLRPAAATLPGVQTSKSQSPSRAFSKLFTALGSWPSCMRKH